MGPKRLDPKTEFELLWYDRPRLWLEDLAKELQFTSEDLWYWTAVHHQVLTLVSTSEHRPGVSVLWFRAQSSEHPNLGPSLFGCARPHHQTILIETPALRELDSPQSAALSQQLVRRLAPRTVMGSRETISKMTTAMALKTRLHEQLAWRKNLSQSKTSKAESTAESTAEIHLRLVRELDRPQIERWAEQFAIESSSNVIETKNEALALLASHKLFVFENVQTRQALGMLALSGDLTFAGNDHSKPSRSLRISLLFVDPAFRGRHIGSSAMQAIEAEAVQSGAESLVLFSSGERGARFYSRLGYDLCGEWLEVSVNTTG